ncbi:hypothetical protein AB434_3804 [Heyndrickxia coagulans]|uniref:Uncharacterized protein n=1 Tax=Heyndrickxia coagulans TaxID=1398 RepID=A0AAN0WBF6_HEYCO|nr:hypothetical protein SB48_HM08orf02309 [Heyndrickxia coagulans]AKN56209.1 hypothetical protein AB434_3804 [Heyndrickxia coagulans]KYC64792.1 hypothetical protein B4100_2744 [Heyndrickxia coagulans]KYC92025.1 hypothetical protein B4096_2981 [Heyndrickxia coagulans]
MKTFLNIFSVAKIPSFSYAFFANFLFAPGNGIAFLFFLASALFD